MQMEYDFFQHFPKMVLFEITTKCNLTCSYCVARALVKDPADLPLEQIIQLKDRLAVFDYIALCGLGESLVHRDFYKVLEIFKEQKIVLVSNGSVPIDFQRLTAYRNVDAISFSVDGATEDSMRKTCSNYRFETLLKNLENAQVCNVNVAFNCTVTKDNLSELELLQDMAVKYNVKRVKIGLPLGQEKWVRQNMMEICQALQCTAAKIQSAGLIYEGPFQVKCTFENAPIAVISKNGNMYPCCDYYCGRPLVGNLFHADFSEMWEKRSYADFRTGRFCAKCKQYHNQSDLIELAAQVKERGGGTCG